MRILACGAGFLGTGNFAFPGPEHEAQYRTVVTGCLVAVGLEDRQSVASCVLYASLTEQKKDGRKAVLAT